MREIIFKGKPIDSDTFIFGSLLVMNQKYYIYPHTYGDLNDTDFGLAFIEVQEDSVGQFINMYDDCDNKLFENDKVEDNYTEANGIITYEDGEFNCGTVFDYKGFSELVLRGRISLVGDTNGR